MDTIVEIVKNVLVIIILTSFLELLLPEGGLKPFVRYAIGLFVIVAVLNPILTVLFNRHQFEVSWWDVPAVQQEQDQIKRGGGEILGQIGAVGAGNLQKTLEGQVSALVHLVPGVKDVETRVSIDKQGKLTDLKIKVHPEPLKMGEKSESASLQGTDEKYEQETAKVLKGRVKDLLDNLYNFPGATIEIIVEGG